VAVGRKLIVRAYSLLKRYEKGEIDVHYEFHDLEGNIITKKQASDLAHELWAKYRIEKKKKEKAR
jgi:hypothetical protein